MTGTRYYSRSGGAIAARTGNVIQNVGAMGGILRDFAAATTELQGAILRDLTATLRDIGLSGISLRHARSCSFPEAVCCDPDLGVVTRDAHQGETVRIPVRFRNTTGRHRSFTIAVAGPFKDLQGRAAKEPTVTPTSFDLDDGEASQVVVATPVGDDFAVGSEYSTRLIVRSEGCEDQHLTVTIRVSTDAGPVIRLCCGCEPGLRPLRWYHHYYCDPPKRAPQQQEPGITTRPGG
jgi:hypothetical protein